MDIQENIRIIINISMDLCKLIILHFTFHWDFLIVFEKINDDYINELICYDMKSKYKIVKNNNIWKYNPSTSYCIHKTINDCLIYRIGGWNNKEVPNIEYSLKHDIHIELPLSQTVRYGSSTIFNTLNGLITIGGYDSNNNNGLSTVEIMNDKKQWKYLKSMNIERTSCSSTTFENKIFVFGGYELNSNEMYSFDNNTINTNNNKWINLTNMKNNRFVNGIKYYQIKNQIILIGGNHDENIKSFEMFDIIKNKFIEYPCTLELHRWKPGIVIENNNLIYIIGDEMFNSYGVIEYFDIRDNKWFIIDKLDTILEFGNEIRWSQCVLNFI